MVPRYGFAHQLKELRFLFCQTGEQSAGVRAFLNSTYPIMKKHNPHTPILIREATGIQPQVFARYEFGKEKHETLTGLTDQEVKGKINTLVKLQPT